MVSWRGWRAGAGGPPHDTFMRAPRKEKASPAYGPMVQPLGNLIKKPWSCNPKIQDL